MDSEVTSNEVIVEVMLLTIAMSCPSSSVEAGITLSPTCFNQVSAGTLSLGNNPFLSLLVCFSCSTIKFLLVKL